MTTSMAKASNIGLECLSVCLSVHLSVCPVLITLMQYAANVSFWLLCSRAGPDALVITSARLQRIDVDEIS